MFHSLNTSGPQSKLLFIFFLLHFSAFSFYPRWPLMRAGFARAVSGKKKRSYISVHWPGISSLIIFLMNIQVTSLSSTQPVIYWPKENTWISCIINDVYEGLQSIQSIRCILYIQSVWKWIPLPTVTGSSSLPPYPWHWGLTLDTKDLLLQSPTTLALPASTATFT